MQGIQNKGLNGEAPDGSAVLIGISFGEGGEVFCQEEVIWSYRDGWVRSLTHFVAGRSRFLGLARNGNQKTWFILLRTPSHFWPTAMILVTSASLLPSPERWLLRGGGKRPKAKALG